jgi:hypothetical protein
MKVYKRECSKCHKELIYLDYRHWWRAEQEKSICRSCSKKGKPNGRFGTRHSAKTIEKIRLGNIGKHSVSTDTRTKLSIARKGMKLPLEWKQKMWHRTPWNKGKTHSEETKLKLRIATIEHLRKNGVKFGCDGAANFNPNACKFIDNLNLMFGWKIRHAKNGGEVEIYGYFVDGYDEKRNIIIEYDEPRHYKGDGTLKSKDVRRQNRIINKVNPSKFLRYNEKENVLYDAITGDVFKITR